MKKYQVFISSTYLDLKAERQAAVSAILKSGHIPAGMELFTANDKNQWETIKGWIDESDIYMLILGGRYGSVEPKSGKCYTELEFDYAVDCGKPLFSVVIDDDLLKEKMKVNVDFGERENYQKWKEFKDKVTSYMVSFFNDEKDIRLAVLESLPDLARRGDLSGWISGAEVPEATGLIAEISKLSEEISALRKENDKLKEKTKSNNNDDGIFELIINVLERSRYSFPKEEYNLSHDIERSALQLMNLYKSYLIRGVIEGTTGTKMFDFFMAKVFPLYVTHGLAEMEKVAGNARRRCIFSQKGRSFLAYLDVKNLKKNDD
ncbi:TPA: DUF4062 domain-containing protein [Serratia fonticola]